MKRIIITCLITSILLFTGCDKTVDRDELYGVWRGNTITSEQSLNNFIVTKTDYILNLYADGTFHEEITITSRSITADGDGNVNTYKLDGKANVEVGLGVKLITTNWESSNPEVKGLASTMSNQMLYFEVSNKALTLCCDATCNDVLIKDTTK